MLRLPRSAKLWASLALAAILHLAPAALAQAAPSPDPLVAQRFTTLSRATIWTLTASIKPTFKTFHPQGMVKIGDAFYVSSVEIRTAPKTLASPRDGQDRDAGAGVGHLFKIGPNGALLADLILGEGAAYHPGGIDFDGTSIWVPVSEYRPNSRAIVYRVDPTAMRATEAFRFADHIGGLAYDRPARTLLGISWGARRFYSWRMGADGEPAKVAALPKANPEHYVDYQDCHFVGAHRMLCSGVGDYRTAPGETPFQLGGLDLVDMKLGRPLWQVPIQLRSPTGRIMTQNPFFMEATATGLRAYFMPDDDDSTIFVFEAMTLER